MNRFNFLEKLIFLERLIRQEQTGTPNELAKRLSISRGALYRIIEELEARGVEIKYCRTRCSFYYKNDTFLDIRFDIKNFTEMNNDELKRISGGCCFFNSVSFFEMEML